jgi:hypothetical protein
MQKAKKRQRGVARAKPPANPDIIKLSGQSSMTING